MWERLQISEQSEKSQVYLPQKKEKAHEYFPIPWEYLNALFFQITFIHNIKLDMFFQWVKLLSVKNVEKITNLIQYMFKKYLMIIEIYKSHVGNI